MKNDKYYLLLNRWTNLEFKKEDVKDYLEQCEVFNEIPNPAKFLDYLGCTYFFDNFLEEIDDTEVEDGSQFYKLIEEIKKND